MDKHTILIIEDDETAAGLLIDTVEGLGYAHKHVNNREDAEKAIDQDDYCVVMLDQEIFHKPGHIAKSVAAGRSLIEYVRERHPGQGDRRRFLLQIIVMSGVAKDLRDVKRAFQYEANDYLVKPFTGDDVEQALHNALRHSGRRSHDRCPELMKLARKGGPLDASAPAKPASASPAVAIDLTGRPEGKRLRIQVGGKPHLLTLSSFVCLLQLAAASEAGDGWVDRDLVGGEEYARKQMSRLRDDFRALLPDEFQLVKNDRNRSYRLHPDACVTADWPSLAEHPIGKIQEIAKKRSARRAAAK